MADSNNQVDRRSFVKALVRTGGAIGLGGAAVALAAARGGKEATVWQIDPDKCIACGNCATYCVLEPSAVKCMHNFKMCGYCRPCFGYFDLDSSGLNSGAENQLCPVGAIQRTFVEDPYYEYKIDKALCIGCGKCVKGCNAFGNGALYLQVCHDRCVGCNECSIAAACPSEAFRRVPASDPYLLKGRQQGADGQKAMPDGAEGNA